MYHLRRVIRDRSVSVDGGLRSVEDTLGQDLGSLVDEALQSKCPEDGQNMLMYAAAQGNEAWFLRLVGDIRSKLRVHALVKELREVDIYGAPLLFHAASTRRQYSCFRTVRDLLFLVLGNGGLDEQLEAVDGLGRGILMHAARGNHVTTFRDVFAMRKEAFEAMHLHDQSKPVVTVRTGENQPAASALTASAGMLRTLLGKTDINGMSCLHHAAQAGCGGVLKEVKEKLQEEAGMLYEDMNKPDKSARTPIMLVLCNECCHGGKESERRKNDLKAKFDLLHEPILAGQMMKTSAIPSRFPPHTTVTQTTVETRAVTQLLHAARGGLTSLEIALNALPESVLEDGNLGPMVNVDKALAVMEIRNERWWSSPQTSIWGRALLLAAAAKCGDEDLLRHVVDAIKVGYFSLERSAGVDRLILAAAARTDVLQDEENATAQKQVLKDIVKVIAARGRSLFAYAILSERIEAVRFVYRLVVDLFEGERDEHVEIWKVLSGHVNDSSSLACAASLSMEAEQEGRTMFDFVFGLLKEQAARRPREAKDLMRHLLCVRKYTAQGRIKISPLMVAALKSNWVLFREVYDSYERETESRWPRQKVIDQIPSGPPHRRFVVEHQELHDCQASKPPPITRGAWIIPAVMWRDIVKAYMRGEPESNSQEEGAQDRPPQPWREVFKDYSRRAVKVAGERGSFTALRELVQEGFPLHSDYILAILQNIGDHEQDVIEIILATIANASNPFATGAGVSRMLRMSEVDHPTQQKGLRRLQRTIDDFTNELLDTLPHTVRGMGVALIGGHQPIAFGEGLQQGMRHRLSNLAGFIVVKWMLEPRLLVGTIIDEDKDTDPAYIDPLQQALNRGAKGLEFLNSRLVLDYVQVKFTGTLPSWTSMNPYQPTVNEGFYKYDEFDKYELLPLLSGTEKDEPPREEKTFLSMNFLLRFLQGWDHVDSKYKWNIPLMTLLDEEGDTEGETRRGGQELGSQQKKLVRRIVPHSAILPGLQFSLAGILGKPETFYKVPAIRFGFEIFGYLVMLAFFCSSVLLKDSDVIPFDEATFYVFTAGMACREILEFLDNMPGRRHSRQSTRTTTHQQNNLPRSLPRISFSGNGQGFNRLVSAFTRYVIYDTWNFLDTLTICCILVALTFRMIAFFGDSSFLFLAQFFYALSAPLLFSRLLVLSQIDATLGPMTQVIWRMMSHTLRFSAFIAVVMLSFALAFHAIFHTCSAHTAPDGCKLDDAPDFPLHDAFGTFGKSFVTVFSFALGGPNFDIFNGAGSDCRCDLPDAARNAGIFLMVVYMITMAVVLLNLLIAVLSTAHDQVYANAEKEFHHARARLIYQSALVVSERRPPPPLNLIKLVSGLVADTGTELLRFSLWAAAHFAERTGDVETRGDRAKAYRDRSRTLQPCSTTPEWGMLEDGFQTLAFACTVGTAVVALSAILWIVSVPWVAWCLLRMARPVERETTPEDELAKEGEDEVHDGEQKVKRGYCRGLVSICQASVTLFFAAFAALALCFFYIVGSAVLWVLGVVWMCRALEKSRRRRRNGNTPKAMAGQDIDGDHWTRAWELACLRNDGVGPDRAQGHFHVLPLLKSRTGLNMQHLVRLSKARDVKSTAEGELVDVDRKQVDARIDLEHLQLMARMRAQQRWNHRQDDNIAAPPNTQAGGETKDAIVGDDDDHVSANGSGSAADAFGHGARGGTILRSQGASGSGGHLPAEAKVEADANVTGACFGHEYENGFSD